MRKILILLLSLLVSVPVLAQSNAKRNVSGQVLGPDGMPVIGAAVIIAGTSNGAVTDDNGKYQLRAGDDDILIFSCIGYAEVREKVSARKLINVVLQDDVTVLEEAVAIGYGTQAKSDLTGAVGVVSMDKLEPSGVTSIDQALQGRIAGMDIISGGGEPGEGSSIRIRGTRSISASNDPLIVVDGVIDAVESFSDINPDDIKSVTVLKDASSTAIYGSRGSNGVILVTTRGDSKASKVEITASTTQKISMLPKKLDVMNAAEFAQFRDDFLLTYGTVGTDTPYGAGSKYSFANPSQYGTGTDWQSLLTRPAWSQTYRLSFKKGNGQQWTYCSASFDDNQGIVLGSDMKRVTGLFKMGVTIFKWLKMEMTANYTWRHNDLNKININGINSSAAVCLSPLVGKEDIWNRYADESDGGAIFDNPYLKATKETMYRNTQNLTLAPTLKIELPKNIRITSKFSYYITHADYFAYSPSTMPLATWRRLGGTAARQTRFKQTFLSETTAEYNKTIAKKHKIDVMLGFTAQETLEDNHNVNGSGYLDDNVGPYNLGAIIDRRNLRELTSKFKTTRMSALARANYSWESRYFVTLTARADGSSIFAEGHKWGFFPAAAFKWTVSNEPWMRSVRDKVLSGLSLRLSAGRSGNDALSSYVSQSVLTTTASSWVFGDVQSLAAYPSRLDNPNLTWEKTDSYNAGVDLSLLKDRITLTADAYLSYTSDLLLTLQNAHHTGYVTRYANFGSTRGWGAELSLSTKNISTRHFVWSTDFSISHDSSIVTELGNGLEYMSTYSTAGQMVFGYKKGYPANAIWGYRYGGVWHNDAERAENQYTKMYVSYENRNGFSKYVDVNHDGILNSEDYVYLGSTDPLLYGGLQNTFRYKNLEWGFYFTYSIGGVIYNLTETLLGTGAKSSNKYRYMIDAWHPVRNPDSDIPAAYSRDGYMSDRFVHDASYLRLKSAHIAYTLDLSRKIKWLRDISFRLSGDNLWLLAGYNGFDPDVTASKSVRRLDNASYPNPRSIMFSVRFRY